jgi:hypothetical protein
MFFVRKDGHQNYQNPTKAATQNATEENIRGRYS